MGKWSPIAVQGGHHQKSLVMALRKAPNEVKKGKSGNNDGDKEADNSDEEYVTQPNEHFENLVEVDYLNHAYPIKPKLKESTMMKKFMTSRDLSKGKNPKETLAEMARHLSSARR
jgi:hypothetical protein